MRLYSLLLIFAVGGFPCAHATDQNPFEYDRETHKFSGVPLNAVEALERFTTVLKNGGSKDKHLNAAKAVIQMVFSGKLSDSNVTSTPIVYGFRTESTLEEQQIVRHALSAARTMLKLYKDEKITNYIENHKQNSSAPSKHQVICYQLLTENNQPEKAQGKAPPLAAKTKDEGILPGLELLKNNFFTKLRASAPTDPIQNPCHKSIENAIDTILNQKDPIHNFDTAPYFSNLSCPLIKDDLKENLNQLFQYYLLFKSQENGFAPDFNMKPLDFFKIVQGYPMSQQQLKLPLFEESKKIVSHPFTKMEQATEKTILAYLETKKQDIFKDPYFGMIIREYGIPEADIEKYSKDLDTWLEKHIMNDKEKIVHMSIRASIPYPPGHLKVLRNNRELEVQSTTALLKKVDNLVEQYSLFKSQRNGFADQAVGHESKHTVEQLKEKCAYPFPLINFPPERR